MPKLFVVPLSFKILKAFFASGKQVVQDTQCLNVYIKGINDVEFRDIVYSMKDRMTAWFYKSGYCKDVLISEHVLMCNSWRFHSPHGDRSPEQCPKCHGTSIYKVSKLYLYRFEYDGVRWGWHQPLDRALITPTITIETENPETVINRYVMDEYGDIEQRFWNSYIFLLLRGQVNGLDLTREYKINFAFVFRNQITDIFVHSRFNVSRKQDPKDDIPF